MLEIIPFDRKLLETFRYNGVESELSGSDISEIGEFYARMGDAYIVRDGEKILGAGGIYPLWKNAGSVWLFLNKEIEHYKFSLYKILLEYMKKLTDKYEIKMLTVNCLESSMKANNLTSHLGFTKIRELKMALYTRKTE